MGRKLTLNAADGFELGAYRADPDGTPRGRVVVIQEIFGVNQHIRSVCDRLAEAGYIALAPQIFDRIERDYETGYSSEEVAHARSFIPKLDWDKVMADTEAAVDELTKEGSVAIIGFCLGGSVSWLAATRFGGTLIARASALALRLKGAMNSSRRISPGWMGRMALAGRDMGGLFLFQW